MNVSLYSSWIYGKGCTALEIMAIPCGSVPDGSQDVPRDDCVWDKQEIMEYLDTVQIVAIYNQGNFRQDMYGQERISWSSQMQKVILNPEISNWIGAYIDKHVLIDETAYLQYG